MSGENISFIVCTLTINFVIHRSMGMEDAECMDKFLKFNDSIPLFIKNVKNLEETTPFVR